MAVKALFGFATRLLESILLPEFFGLPSLSRVDGQTHFTQEAVQMLFANLNRAECGIPLPILARASHGLHIFYHSIRERQNLFQLSYHTGFGFPSAPRRRGNALFTLEAIVETLGSAPLAMPPPPSHGSPDLYGIFDVRRGFHHQIKHRVLCANDTEALKFTPWVDAHDQGLVIRFLLIAQLDVEQTELVPLWPGIATLKQVASFGRSAGHLWDALAINNGKTHRKGFPFTRSEPG